MDIAELKKQIAYKAVDTLVHSNMKLGLGTGSTAIWVSRRIGELLKNGMLSNIMAVPTSLATRIECEVQGIPVVSLSNPALGGRLDLTIDGADEIDPEHRLIKGGGGAQLREKICAYASDDFAVVADAGKLVKQLGITFPVPVEVIPEALYTASEALESLGGRPKLRMGTTIAGPAFTEHGNLILDTSFDGIGDPVSLEKEINLITGVVENGIFTCPVGHLIIGNPDGSVTHTA
ncbi:MAG: ribose-5-phosphate isomerase RpiA [Spirochaetaceae bacterium]|nr:MAG: ribose-5-phosphate isomerase RpiA [Spirochaetaceae bacterium]